MGIKRAAFAGPAEAEGISIISMISMTRKAAPRDECLVKPMNPAYGGKRRSLPREMIVNAICHSSKAASQKDYPVRELFRLDRQNWDLS
jgi:hypothetical protein